MGGPFVAGPPGTTLPGWLSRRPPGRALGEAMTTTERPPASRRLAGWFRRALRDPGRGWWGWYRPGRVPGVGELHLRGQRRHPGRGLAGMGPRPPRNAGAAAIRPRAVDRGVEPPWTVLVPRDHGVGGAVLPRPRRLPGCRSHRRPSPSATVAAIAVALAFVLADGDARPPRGARGNARHRVLLRRHRRRRCPVDARACCGMPAGRASCARAAVGGAVPGSPSACRCSSGRTWQSSGRSSACGPRPAVGPLGRRPWGAWPACSPARRCSSCTSTRCGACGRCCLRAMITAVDRSGSAP